MIQCPKCRSENVQSFQAAYESGLYTVDAKTKPFLDISFITRNLARFRTSCKPHTELSKKTAPPKKRSYIWPIVIGFAAGFLFRAFATEFLARLTSSVVLFTGGSFFYRAFIYNRDQWPDLMETWQSMFICDNCGFEFERGN